MLYEVITRGQVDKNDNDASGTAMGWGVNRREGRLPPLPIELEKSPATLKSHVSFRAAVSSIGTADGIGNRLEG